MVGAGGKEEEGRCDNDVGMTVYGQNAAYAERCTERITSFSVAGLWRLLLTCSRAAKAAAGCAAAGAPRLFGLRGAPSRLRSEGHAAAGRWRAATLRRYLLRRAKPCGRLALRVKRAPRVTALYGRGTSSLRRIEDIAGGDGAWRKNCGTGRHRRRLAASLTLNVVRWRRVPSRHLMPCMAGVPSIHAGERKGGRCMYHLSVNACRTRLASCGDLGIGGICLKLQEDGQHLHWWAKGGETGHDNHASLSLRSSLAGWRQLYLLSSLSGFTCVKTRRNVRMDETAAKRCLSRNASVYLAALTRPASPGRRSSALPACLCGAVTFCFFRLPERPVSNAPRRTACAIRRNLGWKTGARVAALLRSLTPPASSGDATRWWRHFHAPALSRRASSKQKTRGPPAASCHLSAIDRAVGLKHVGRRP